MKRSTWLVVAGACLALVAAGSLPRLPWDEVTSAWRDGATRAVANWPVFEKRIAAPRPAVVKRAASASATVRSATTRRAMPRFTMPALPPLPSLPRAAGPGTYALLGALAGLGVLGVLHALGRESRRGRVFRMARQGRPTSRIAREAGLAQDAVRVLLTPGVGSRRR